MVRDAVYTVLELQRYLPTMTLKAKSLVTVP